MLVGAGFFLQRAAHGYLLIITRQNSQMLDNGSSEGG